MDEILGNPLGEGKYQGPTLFVFGNRSDYYQPADQTLLDTGFPNHQKAFLETGHWVQAEKPEEFVKTVLAFLRP